MHLCDHCVHCFWFIIFTLCTCFIQIPFDLVTRLYSLTLNKKWQKESGQTSCIPVRALYWNEYEPQFWAC